MNIPASRLFLCFIQVGRKVIKLTGIIARMRMFSTVSDINWEIAGNKTITNGMAKQCNKHKEERA